MAYRFFEDFTVGETLELGPVTLTEPEIIAYASQYDPQPMHTDPVAAATITNGLIASGWHTASAVMGVFVGTRPYQNAPGTLGLGVDDMRWHQPVRPGDAISVHVEFIVLRPSASKPDRGIVTSRLTARNQRAEPVLTLTLSALVPKRP